MLAIDIETMGLDKNSKQCPITMICIYNPTMSIQKSYPFLHCVDPNTGDITNNDLYHEMVQDLLQHLHEAKQIASYNGVLFDLPFIAAKFRVPDSVLCNWIMKSIDMFYSMKMTLNKYFKMKDILTENSMEDKSADGLQAIAWAREGQTSLLEDYCMQDTVLTWKLCTSDRVLIPHTVKNKQLAWSSTNVFYLV